MPEPSPTVMAPTQSLLSVQGLVKRYGSTVIFQGVDLSLAQGECVALLGESGVGKSTLLNCIAGLDEPSEGQVLVRGQVLAALNDDQRALLRREHLGFVFQAFHVLAHLTVADNVSLPLRLLGKAHAGPVARVLGEVGLHAQALLMPAQLSGGQLQRVAIARALVHQPALILADEPTGNLDPDTADKVLTLMLRRVRDSGAACLLVTHSQAAAARADRMLRLTATGVAPALHSGATAR